MTRLIISCLISTGQTQIHSFPLSFAVTHMHVHMHGYTHFHSKLICMHHRGVILPVFRATGQCLFKVILALASTLILALKLKG